MSIDDASGSKSRFVVVDENVVLIPVCVHGGRKH
jgi:hypothetical protein